MFFFSKLFLCKTLTEFADVVRQQVTIHGRSCIKAQNYVNYPTWDLRVGIESPDGCWMIKIKTIRYTLVNSDCYTNEDIIKRYQNIILKAVSDGEQLKSMPRATAEEIRLV